MTVVHFKITALKATTVQLNLIDMERRLCKDRFHKTERSHFAEMKLEIHEGAVHTMRINFANRHVS